MIIMNRKGFTLLEVILVLSILSVIASLFPTVIKTISPPKHTGIHPHELAIFFQQIGSEIKGSKSAEVKESSLFLLLPSGTVISYEQSGNKLIRKVNGTGYELVLQNVFVFESKIRQGTIALYVSDSKKLTYNRRYLMYIQKYQGENL
jgi:competence protein ComGF